MKIGIGYNNNIDAFSSGKKVIEKAVKNGQINDPKFAIAFCNNKIDHEKFFNGMQQALNKNIPIIGGSGLGIITNDDLSYTDYPAGAVVIEDEDLEIQLAVKEGLDKDEYKVGKNLVKKLSFDTNDKLLLFYDSIKNPPTTKNPPMMNSSRPLIKGIEDNVERKLSIFGGGTIGDFIFSNTQQFCGNSVKSQSAVALLLKGNANIDYKIMHGCSPKDGIYHTITKIEGPVIYELDGKPIIELINEIYGNDEWQKQVPVKRLTIGVNHGDKFEDEYIEDNYVNRLITGILPDKSGIVIFEPDFEVGTEVLFMLRDGRTMIESTKNNSRKLLDQLVNQKKKIYWGFYIDCAGRAATFSETLREEARELQEIFNEYKIPLFGFYSGVEIAPFIGGNKGLDWTGVLALFTSE